MERRGRVDSMEEIYKKHASTVYAFLLNKTQDAEMAEELTQETFYRAVKNIDKFKGNSSVITWLCGISKNLWYDYLKKHKNEISTDDDSIKNHNSQHSIENHVDAKWDSMEILKALHKIDDPMREVIYLRLISNLSFKDIGEIIGKSENWARVNFYRGKEKIIKEVADNERKNSL